MEFSTPPDFEGHPIIEAIETGAINRVRKMLAMDRSLVRIRDEIHGEEPLHAAAHSGQKGISMLLIELGADIDAQDDDGRTPLHHACEAGAQRVVQTLVEHGANMKLRDQFGFTPLNLALRQLTDEGYSISRMLIEHGCEIDLNSAILMGDVKRVKQIGKYIPDEVRIAPLREDMLADTLHWCRSALDGHLGISLDTMTESECIENAIEILTVLLSNGVDIDGRTESGTTALYESVQDTRLLRVTRYLLDQGARADVTEFNGETARDIAVRMGNHEAVDLLDGP